jgi:cell division protein FtsI/penicillin-binding protein 2
MAGWIASSIDKVGRGHRQWRRARNLRAGSRVQAAPAVRSMAVAIAGVVLAGGAVIVLHARHLGGAVGDGSDTAPAGAASMVDALHSAVPGAAFDVPSAPGMHVTDTPAGAIVVAQGMRTAPPVLVNLCRQTIGATGRLLPVRIGYRFDDVARLVKAEQAAGRPLALPNVVLEGAGQGRMPRLQITGLANATFSPLQLAWSDVGGARMVSDAGPAAFERDAWLVWRDGALRLHRRRSASCSAGELVLQMHRKADPGRRALVTAFPRQGAVVTAWLQPGHYVVPHIARASLEDQALFQQLLAHGLLRLAAAGGIDVAPRDLALWQQENATGGAGALAAWPRIDGAPATAKLFKRLYRMADGAYVREQVRIFNTERRLLAWRLRPGTPFNAWQASLDGAPLATTPELPPAAARLFAQVPQGWAPWRRVAAWPEGRAASVRLAVRLPQAAAGGERVEMLVVGRVRGAQGARLVGQRPACTGRGCAAPDAAQALTLELLPGARSLALALEPLDMTAAAAIDQSYRHLRVASGVLRWTPLATNSSTARRSEPAAVRIVDRHGALLWNGTSPTPDATRAGLGPLLGLHAEHRASVAGMLARIESPDGQPHQARLSLDLALQAASHRALDCVGMRRGRWDGVRCEGGQTPPEGRQAGIVILDADNGDVLAAAGAGTGRVDAANWTEVRDFDRANPDRSPLRLPALQHDGGVHRSPGSTFKIISALGLELAAQRDPQVEALLGGMPLAAINRLAQRRGFAFQTGGATYPFGTRLAHITNFRDQHLDRRAQQGRFGLPQALTYSLNTWFAWSGELTDRSLFGRADGGAPDLQALEPGALDAIRPIAAMAGTMGFGQQLRLDGGLLPADFRWTPWDALEPSQARIDPIHTRHELRQMAIGLRMQVTPLQMAMVAGAIGQGRTVAPRLLLELDGETAAAGQHDKLGVRLDRIRAGLKGVVDAGTAQAAFRGAHLAKVRRGLSGKTGTSPAMVGGRELATVWFTGWLESGSLPGQRHRLAVAAFVSHSEATGGEHAAPVVAAILSTMPGLKGEQKGK